MSKSFNEKSKNGTSENNARLNEASQELLALLPRYRVKTHLQIVPQTGLRRLNIRLVEKQPELTLTGNEH